MSDDDVRKTTLESLRATAKKFFAEKPAYRSMLFGVAQYWADEADDAVHYDIVASARARPLWPHRCEQTAWDDDGIEDVPGECCWNCEEGFEYIDWDDNGDAISAFELFCHESGSQEEPASHNYLPYAIARKVGDDIEIEIVGRLQRPEIVEFETGEPDATWDDERARELLALVAAAPTDDGPRRVLADYLMEQENPRGDYIALALHGKPEAAALLAEHRTTWMHPVSLVVPDHAATWTRGFLSAVEVYAGAADAKAVRGAQAWSTVEKLLVYPGSESVLDPAMRSLREVGPLDPANGWLDDLVAATQPWAIETLHVAIDKVEDAAPLCATTNLPALRHLVITSANPDAVVASLPHARWWSQLERLTIMTSTPNVTTWSQRHRELAVPWLAIANHASDPADAAGWEVAFGPGGACEITQRGYSPQASLAELARILPQIPAAASIKLVPSAYYEPSQVDVDRLAPTTSHQLTL